MKTAGIICECNPMHGGHRYLIERARASGCDRVLCIMSGCFVQRGEAAIAEPYLRAEAIVAAGADAVLELPFPYAAASAEYFAAAGVDILSRLGVEELWFGSECGDIHALRRAAEVCESDAFREAYAEKAAKGAGTAEAYFATLRALCGEDVPISPNDILGIAYLRAIAKSGGGMTPVTVTRMGSGYREAGLSDGEFPSATALRAKWVTDGKEAILALLPAQCRAVYARAEAPFLWKHAERLVLGSLRLCDPEALADIAELAGGLGNRLHQAAQEANGFEELVSLAATKKYPTARILRGILFALTGITSADLKAPPAYVRLLAATREGCRVLSECRREKEIAVITRKADLPVGTAAERQALLETRAWGLYALCAPDGVNIPSPWTKNPTIVN